MISERLKRALTENRVETAPDHPDPGLRGRTYSVPFEAVWRAALSIADERPGWTVVRTDDLAGRIEIEARTRVFHFVDDVEIRIVLDRDAQTRVDVSSESRKGRGDLGTNGRRVRGFFRELDRRVAKRAERVRARR